MVATEAAEDIKASVREAPGLGSGLRGVKLRFIWSSQNMATMKDRGKKLFPSSWSPALCQTYLVFGGFILSLLSCFHI